jgi:hypothetical protein
MSQQADQRCPGWITVPFVSGEAYDCPVLIDTDCAYRGLVTWDFDYNGNAIAPVIRLREYNERVLLHELLHVLVGLDPSRVAPPSHPSHEALVRHITRGLWDAGWRLEPHTKIDVVQGEEQKA